MTPFFQTETRTNPRLRLFVTATDTDAGKTFACRLLLQALAAHARTPMALKPLSSGGVDDVIALRTALAHDVPVGQMNFASFAMPATPSVAARAEGREVNPEALLAWCREKSDACAEPLLLEAVGGWLAPISGTWCVADWAEALRWPILVVVANRLGCINHALLTANAIRERRLPLAGILLNNVTPPTSNQDISLRESNLSILRDEFLLPVIGEIPFGATSLPSEVLQKLLPV